MTLPRLSRPTVLIVVGLAALLLCYAGLTLGGPRGATSLGLLAGAGLGLLALLVGLILYVVLPSLSPAAATRGYASYGTMVAMLAVAAIPANLVSLAYLRLVQPTASSTLTPGAIFVSVVSLEAALLSVLYLRIVRPGVLTWRDLGLRVDRLVVRVGQGLVAGFLLLLSVGALQAALRAGGVQQTQALTYEGLLGAPLGSYLLVLVAGAVLAPIAEESFFRGYVFTACRREKGPWRAYLFSAGLFAVVHFNLPALLPIFAIGLGLAFIFARFGSLVPSIVAHGLNNALAFSVLYFASTGG